MEAAPQAAAALAASPDIPAFAIASPAIATVGPAAAAAESASEPTAPALAPAIDYPGAIDFAGAIDYPRAAASAPDRPKALPRLYRAARPLAPKEPDREREKLTAMRDQAKALQDEQVRQAKLTFNVAIGLVIVGVLIIFAGSVVTFLQAEKATTGTFTAVGGAVAEIISLILFRFHKVTNDKLDALRGELSAIEYSRFGMTLIEQIDDPIKRDDAIREIVRNLTQGKVGP